MKLVLGLGNPGADYAATRHNAGFRVVERLRADLGAPAFAPCGETRLSRARTGGAALWLAEPLTYMNRSGFGLADLLDAAEAETGAELAPERLLVVTDDVHLPLGRLRLRTGGSAGGHNGLASIEEVLGHRDWPRLRVGVGAPGAEGLVDYVLGAFGPGEEPVLAEVIPAAASAARAWAEEGPAAAQERWNGWTAPSASPEEAAPESGDDDETAPAG
jgi:PTH1 family peptidyl-tRNA hydrolase